MSRLLKIMIFSCFFMGAFLIVVDYFLSNDKENRKYIKKEEKWFEFSKEKKAQILFVGDMMFDRRIREITEKNGGDYIFSCIIER